MKTATIILTLSTLIILSIFWTGCSSDDNTGNLEVRITKLPDTISAPIGATRELEFRIGVTEKTGYAAANVLVSLEVTSGPGEVEPLEDITDDYGRLDCKYIIHMSAASGTAVITARTETNNSASVSVIIEPTAVPENVAISATPAVVFTQIDERVTIDLAARITDGTGMAVEGITPLVTLEAQNISDTTFGELSDIPATNTNGISEFTFTSLGEFGDLLVRCVVDSLDGGSSNTQAVASISILPRERMVGNITLSVAPDSMFLAPDSQGRANLDISLIDFLGDPISDISLEISALYGRVQETLTTDTAGRARSPYFIQPNVDFPEDVTSLVDNLTVTVHGTERYAIASIHVFKDLVNQPTITMNSDRAYIFADNGATVANVTAWLRDGAGRDMSGYSIRFTSDMGIITTQATTDDGGVAHAIFQDIGQPSLDSLGNVVGVKIKARYNTLGIEGEIRVPIYPFEPVADIQLDVSRDTISVLSTDTLRILATCLRTNGSAAPESTMVHFEADRGFLIDAGNFTDETGVATARIKAGQTAGTANIYAWTNTYGVRTESDIFSLVIIPDVPHHIVGSSDPDTMMAVDAGRSTIRALVLDQFDNPVTKDVHVNFSTDLGELIPTEALTDATGVATIEYRNTGVAGRATINVETDNLIGGLVFVDVLPGDPVSIEATTEDDLLTLFESTNLHVRVLDDLNNPVNTPVIAWAEILGDGFRGRINEHDGADTIVVFNGIADMNYRAGTVTGSIWIKTSCWLDPDSTQVVSDSTMVIVTTQ
ncbi:Ig-like domain-containing protein [Calditrichota bacterium]